MDKKRSATFYWLSLGVIALGFYLWCATLYSVISEYDQLGKTINIAGKQRMLSQRLLILASQKQTEPDEMRPVVRTMLDGHDYLVEQVSHLEKSRAAGPYIEAINGIFYEEPYQLIKTITTFAEIVTQMAGQEVYDQDTLDTHAEHMLAASEEVVKNFQKIYDVMITTLERVLVGSVLGASGILILASFAVGFPLMKANARKTGVINEQ